MKRESVMQNTSVAETIVRNKRSKLPALESDLALGNRIHCVPRWVVYQT